MYTYISATDRSPLSDYINTGTHCWHSSHNMPRRFNPGAAELSFLFSVIFVIETGIAHAISSFK